MPASVQKTYPDLPKKLSPIFIDESNLVAKGTLKTALQANLDSSKYLIVICSPNSAKSEYVNDEVDYFIKSGRAEQIIPLIVDGEPHAEDAAMECFTHALLALPRENEILGIDLKKFGRRDAFLRVIATMLGLDLDSFISNEARERKRKIMIFTPIAAALVIAVGMLAWSSFNYFNFFSEDHPSAQFALGNTFYYKQDYAQALEWYKKAADNGDAIAQYNIGSLYE
ncbi:MAG: TIR domain-containing protein, partial [Synergistaceae bacterium]|nr:TIR domain-containing protein [Synergistaceae bacterium]